MKLKEVELKYNSSLQKIFEVLDKIKDIHPFLRKVFPIAIVENDSFFVFDTYSSERKYVFVKKAPTSMPVPKGVRSAFTLECYKNKVACVISGEIFDSLEGYVIIFHEFMHCCQWEICEPKLKQNLGVAQKAMRKKDYMWEINYPFPYDNSKFTRIYSLFTKSLEENNCDDIFKYRNQLKQILSKDDFEYMVWQEWKEGFARFIENQIRGRLGLKENHYGIEPPFHRISFYESGSRFIEFLSKQKPGLLVEIEKLFYEMLNGEQ